MHRDDFDDPKIEKCYIALKSHLTEVTKLLHQLDDGRTSFETRLTTYGGFAAIHDDCNQMVTHLEKKYKLLDHEKRGRKPRSLNKSSN